MSWFRFKITIHLFTITKLYIINSIYLPVKLQIINFTLLLVRYCIMLCFTLKCPFLYYNFLKMSTQSADCPLVSSDGSVKSNCLENSKPVDVINYYFNFDFLLYLILGRTSGLVSNW